MMKLIHFLTFLFAELAIIKCYEESFLRYEAGSKVLDTGMTGKKSVLKDLTCPNELLDDDSYQNEGNPLANFRKYAEQTSRGPKNAESAIGSNEAMPTIWISILLGLTLLCTWSYFTITCGSTLARLVNKFPGPPLLPLIGCAYIFMGQPQKALPSISAIVKKYGYRFRVWKFHSPYVILLAAKDVEIILSSNKHVNKGHDYEQFRWMNGDGLITSSGDMWREDRKLLNPSFKYQRYDGFLDSFNKHGKILVSVLKKQFPKGNEIINIHPAICRCTMDTVFESILGTTFSIQECAESDDKQDETGPMLYECTKLVMKSYRTRALKPWLCLPVIRNIMGIASMERKSKKYFTEAMIKVIEDRKRALQENDVIDEETKPFIDVLLESRSNQNLVDHAFTIFAAAFETNATAMNFVLFLLALNPSCQKKVHEELDRVFDGDGRDATAKDLAELKYLEMCILETMRHFPPAPMFSRNLGTDVILDDGMIIPRGADVAVFLYELHNDPEVFPSPQQFNPDRFLAEQMRTRHNYAYVPFSKGPRMCIGQKYAMMQMKAVLSHILRDFTVVTKMKRKDVNIVYGAIIEIDCDIFMTLSPRQKVVRNNVV